LNLLRAAAKSGELPDLVLLDSSLPDMDGLELARAIRREKRFESAQVFAHEYGEQTGRSWITSSAGIDGILTKPISLSHLIESMTVALGRTARTDDSIG
jgi:CheY-like chemotaxis protein